MPFKTNCRTVGCIATAPPVQPIELHAVLFGSIGSKASTLYVHTAAVLALKLHGKRKECWVATRPVSVHIV